MLLSTDALVRLLLPHVDGLRDARAARAQAALAPAHLLEHLVAHVIRTDGRVQALAPRRVLVDPTFFTTSFDQVGVLRHELGHVLGFRHEHIRGEAPDVCPDESQTGTVDLTEYDPQSVMHYLCGSMGNKELRITALDKVGSRKVYGPPLAEFRLVE